MEQKNDKQAAPADALDQPASGTGGSMPIGEDAQQSNNDANLQAAADNSKPVKQPGAFKRFYRKVNVYLLGFILVLIVAGAVAIVSFLNSQKPPQEPSIATQELNQDVLKQLANSDATVGGSGQTLTVNGNAIFSGQVLAKQDLGVSGTIQAGTGIIVPQITVSGRSTLSDVQINSLQVANNTTMQGSLTLQRDLNVAGPSAFSGPVTIGQLTVNRLVMSGNASLQIPNHIAFPGATPGRTINPVVLGAGGSASISGSDTAGSISINTGNNTTAGCFMNVTFNQRYTTPPRVIISPVGLAAGQTQYYATRTVTGFSVCTANAAPTGQVFGFDYFVTQ